MNLLLVNPNITESVTATMLAEARRSAAPDVHIDAVTARFGAQYVENRAEAAIASHAVLEQVAENAHGKDGVMIAAFGDPGLAAVRELFDLPVVGIAESALLTARLLGRRAVIVCMTPRLATWYRECAIEHGLGDRLAAVRPLEVPIADISSAREDLREPLLELCLRSVKDNRADVIIVGGGPLAGLARDLADAVPVPLLDGVTCALGLLEMLARQSPRPAREGSFARPAPKPVRGLSPALERRITGID